MLTTVSDAAEAGAVGTRLVEARLAACLQEVAINARYRWQGEVQHLGWLVAGT